MKNPLPKILTTFSFASLFAVETRGTRSCASSLIRRGACIALLPTLFFLALTGAGSAAIIQASDGSAGDTFGGAVSVSGNSSLVGAPYDDNRGSAYVFRNLDTAGGTVTQSVKLIASQRVDFDDFGAFVSLSGSIGLVGNPSYSLGGKRVQGAAYLFRNLNTATGTITQTAKLLASNSAAEDFFGSTVSVSGNIGVIGGLGKAWLFRNLDTATGTVTEAARLTSTDGAVGSSGFITSVSGNAALIGSEKANSSKGAAYLFRNLDAATGTVTQTAKLTASDGAVGDSFGFYSSLSGNIGLVGAYFNDVGANRNQGAVYVFRNLNTATGSIAENAKLVASDGAVNDQLGYGLSHSGSTALVGAPFGATNRGSAYLFRNLDTATGTVTESVKLTASVSAADNYFGVSVSLDGNRFVIGSLGTGAVADSGRAFTGTVSSVTTLDHGNTTESIGGISFTSRIDWIAGETSDANQVNLGQGDSANVAAVGKAVFIGRNAGSDSNVLRINGTLTANEVHIGALAGNQGNTLRLENTAAFQAIAFRLAPANLLKIEGDYTAIGNLLTYLGNTDLEVWNGSTWEDVDGTNHTRLIASSFSSGYTEIRSIPARGVVPVPVLVNPRRSEVNGNASFHFDLLGEAGRTYQLQSSTALDAWTNLNSVTLPAPLLPIQIAIPPGQAQQFYRAIPQ